MSKIAAATQTPSTNRSHFIRAHLLNITAHQVLGTSPRPNEQDKLPGRLQRLQLSTSHDAGPVNFIDLFGVLRQVHSPNHSRTAFSTCANSAGLRSPRYRTRRACATVT